MNSDTSIETSEDEARPYRRDPDMDGMATPRAPVDANDLERMSQKAASQDAKPVAADDDAESDWRRLALQFDNHRMKALAHLRMLLKEPAAHAGAAAEFLAAPPLSGEKVLTQRIAALAAAPQEQAPAAAARGAGLYVEARECTVCQHVGLNDEDERGAACNTCGWTGEGPSEDKCPECKTHGTMSSACPKCGERYRMLCAATLRSQPQQVTK
ncbi:hypothetical protein [Herbaspirillum sp. NPDC101397]|uniref:hypothetical protein n=1 Tax=Herbaspirillum sp. NPDC101397 TaxID=3364006 RepID=UPI00383A2489